MPKVVESKLVFKGDDQISAKMDKINEAIAKMGSLAKDAAENLQAMMDAAMGGTATGARGRGRRATQGSRRSPYAPGGGGGAGEGGGGEPDDEKKRKKRGWMSRIGWGAQAVGAYGTAAGGQITPIVSGGMINVGAQLGAMQTPGKGLISKIPVVGPLLAEVASIGKNITAAALTATGTALGIQHAVGQRGIQHYQQFGAAYRIMGEDKILRARAIAAETGLNPEEGIQLQREMGKAGIEKAYEPIARMHLKGGIFEKELMAPAALAAAGGGLIRPGAKGEADTRKFAKTLAVAFADKGIPSLEQAMESMTHLLEISSTYLGDISDDQGKSLAAMTAWMQLSGTAVLRGPKGMERMAGVVGKMAGVGSPVEQGIKWKAFQRVHPGGSVADFMYWQQDPANAPEYLKQFGVMFGAENPWTGIMAAGPTGQTSYRATGEMVKAAYRGGESWDQYAAKHPEAMEEAGREGGKAVTIPKIVGEQLAIQLEIATKMAKGAAVFETAMVTLADTLNNKTQFSEAADNFSKYAKELADAIGLLMSGKDTVDKLLEGKRRADRGGVMGWASWLEEMTNRNKTQSNYPPAPVM